MKERIQKVIAAQGVCSRRAAEKLIEEGKVKLNGHPVTLGAVCDPYKDVIAISGKRLFIEKKEPIYILLHKPRGYVTTMSDEKGRKTVTELVRDLPERVYPVGRLDMGTEGLLIMTNDGEAANYLTHPSHEVPKEYFATVQGEVADAITKMEAGIELDDGFKTAPAKVREVRSFDDKTILSITICEGHNRQVRRMCEATGLKVKRLVRMAEGQLRLGDIPLGKWRYAKQKEIDYIQSLGKKEDEE